MPPKRLFPEPECDLPLAGRLQGPGLCPWGCCCGGQRGGVGVPCSSEHQAARCLACWEPLEAEGEPPRAPQVWSLQPGAPQVWILQPGASVRTRGSVRPFCPRP